MKIGKKRVKSSRKCRLLCIADHIDPLVYSSAARKRFSHVDLILSCGDLQSDYYDFIITSLNVPFYYVLGNHSPFSRKCSSPLAEKKWKPLATPRRFQGGVMLEGKLVYLKKYDLILGGLGGSRRYCGGDNQYTEFEMACRIIGMIPRLFWNRIFKGRYIDILLTHAAPRGVNDREDLCHRGFCVFNWFLRNFRPRYQIHGHIHLYDRNEPRRAQYRQTEVINAYDHIELVWTSKLTGVHHES